MDLRPATMADAEVPFAPRSIASDFRQKTAKTDEASDCQVVDA